uniref:Uncharacterized protein n=1 Tax=Anguilla anguilla TaxID=7936 RepID=A0A0E9XT70_ANGAN
MKKNPRLYFISQILMMETQKTLQSITTIIIIFLPESQCRYWKCTSFGNESLFACQVSHCAWGRNTT